MAGDLLFEAVAREGALAGQRFMEHTGQGVDVCAGVGRAGAEPLGGHVGPGADGRAGAGQPGFPGGAGDAEVDEIGEVVFGDQDVGRLHIAVHQPDPVRGVQRRGDLLDDAHRARRAPAGRRQGALAGRGP